MSALRHKRYRSLRADLTQAFLSPTMVLSIAGVFVFSLISVNQLIPDWSMSDSVYYVLDLLIGLSMFKKVLVVLAAIPFVTSFCSEWNTQYIRFLVLRGGLRRYIWSKILVCQLSAIFSIICGLLLVMCFLSPFMPLIPPLPNEHPASSFDALLQGGIPVAALLVKVFLFALGNSLWAVCGLTVSAYLPNRFVAILAPFALSYTLEQLTLQLPAWINLYSLLHGSDALTGLGALPNLCYYLAFFGLLIAVCGLIFSHQVQRRMRNEAV